MFRQEFMDKNLTFLFNIAEFLKENNQSAMKFRFLSHE